MKLKDTIKLNGFCIKARRAKIYQFRLVPSVSAFNPTDRLAFFVMVPHTYLQVDCLSSPPSERESPQTWDQGAASTVVGVIGAPYVTPASSGTHLRNSSGVHADMSSSEGVRRGLGRGVTKRRAGNANALKPPSQHFQLPPRSHWLARYFSGAFLRHGPLNTR